MFFSNNNYGSAALSRAFDHIPIPESKRLKQCAAFLGVTERTLSDWITGKKNPPRAACYALWHESTLGRAVTAAHSEQGAHNYLMLSRMQATEITRLQARIDAMAAEVESLKREAMYAPANEKFFSRY